MPSIVLLVGMLFMPETPRHLVHAGEAKRLNKILTYL